MAIYCIADAEDRFVKIGFTDNVIERLASIQAMNPIELKIVCAVNSGRKQHELAIHKALEGKAIRGEWYSLLDDDVKLIVSWLKAKWLPAVHSLTPQKRRLERPVNECIVKSCRNEFGRGDAPITLGWAVGKSLNVFGQPKAICPQCLARMNLKNLWRGGYRFSVANLISRRSQCPS